MISWAFIFEAPETDPKVDRMVIERGGMRNIVVAVPEQAAVVATALDLVAEGAMGAMGDDTVGHHGADEVLRLLALCP